MDPLETTQLGKSLALQLKGRCLHYKPPKMSNNASFSAQAALFVFLKAAASQLGGTVLGLLHFARRLLQPDLKQTNYTVTLHGLAWIDYFVPYGV